MDAGGGRATSCITRRRRSLATARGTINKADCRGKREEEEQLQRVERRASEVALQLEAHRAMLSRLVAVGTACA